MTNIVRASGLADHALPPSCPNTVSPSNTVSPPISSNKGIVIQPVALPFPLPDVEKQKRLADANKLHFIAVVVLVAGLAAVTLALVGGVFKVDFFQIIRPEKVWIPLIAVGGVTIITGIGLLVCAVNTRSRTLHELAHPLPSNLIDEEKQQVE